MMTKKGVVFDDYDLSRGLTRLVHQSTLMETIVHGGDNGEKGKIFLGREFYPRWRLTRLSLTVIHDETPTNRGSLSE